MNTGKRVLLVATALVSVLVVALLFTGWAIAAPPEATPIHKLALTAQDGPRRGTKLLSAVLTDASDSPMGSELVDFYVTVDFFGKRDVKLGTAMTDVTGTAAISYQPKWEGAHEIIARCREHGAQASQSVEFTGPVGRYAGPPVGMEPVRQWAPMILPVAVIAVWVTLALVLLSTLAGISRTPPNSKDRRFRHRQS